MPSAKVNLNGPKINSPNLNISAEIPNHNIKSPDDKIKLSKDTDLSAIILGKSKIDINTNKADTNLDVNLKAGKHKVTDSYMSGKIPGVKKKLI